ncbi:hypothetical protein KC19_1G024300 [Ceratodon purpureus]|uniref:Domain X domain-containing protein n=1 Tax=Ceratodon purpureus TaxID=3225 RepID=A0A8T0J1R7_CERPU|nr:hypothetical protein KC19_1G024300 [Ceratodon purpureus]
MAMARAMQAARVLLRRPACSSTLLPEFHQVDGRILAPLRSCSSLLGTNSSDFAGFEGEFGDGWRAGGLKRSMHTDVSAARVGRRAARVEESEDDMNFSEEDEPREEHVMVRPFEAPVALEAPVKLLYELLQKKGFIDEKVRPLPIDQVASQDDHRIVAWYRSIGIGLLRYHSYCDNLSKVRAIVNYLLRWSAIYTLAKKHKSSSSQIIAKHTKSLVITKNGKTLAAYLTPTEISEYKKKFIVDLDPTPPGELIDMLFARLVRKKLLAERCAVKGCKERNVEMHHIRQIEKAGGRHKVRSAREAQILEGIKAVQSALNKKHIPLCVRHHDDLHMGKVFIDELDMNVVI